MKTTTMSTSDIFKTGNEPIKLLESKGKMTNTTAPMGVGYADDSIRKGAKAVAKFTDVATALDHILVHQSVNALCSEDSVYGEVNDGARIARFVCYGDRVEYEGERLHGHLKFLPFYLFNLRNEAEIPQFKENFLKVKEAYDTTGEAKLADVVYACDTFYYGVLKPQKEFVIDEESLQMETVKKAVASGHFNKFVALKNCTLPNFTGVVLEKRKGVVEDISDADLFEKARNGETVIPYEWKESQKSRIPSPLSLESFVPNSTFASLLKKVRNRLSSVTERLGKGMTGLDAIGKDYVNLFVTGKPGTGKTTLAYALGAATGMPTYTIAMTKNTEEDTFQGMNKVVDGALKFVSTDFLDAYVNGGIIILEEINLPDPSVVMGAIGQAVEYPFVLMKDGYIPVKRHPMCVIIGTMNIGTFGSKGVNQALSSRFRQSYILNDPTKDGFIDILMKGGAKKKDATWVYNAYDKINAYLKSPSVNAEDVCLNVTLRGCIGALENISEGEDAKEAIRNTLIGKISEVDLTLAEDVYKNVVASLPELY